MSAYAVKEIDSMEASHLGAMKRARAELGIAAFGIQVIDLPPNFERYPTHDHSEDGQEEVFVVMRGGGEIEIDSERFPLDTNHVASVGPASKRKLLPGPEGMRVAAIGGVPGAVYEPPESTNLGQPDPMAAS